MDLFDYNDKKIKVFLKDGSTFEGFATHNSFEYSYCEFGIDAECLQICDYLIRDEEIERAELIESVPSIRAAPWSMITTVSCILLSRRGKNLKKLLIIREKEEIPS